VFSMWEGTMVIWLTGDVAETASLEEQVKALQSKAGRS
jgi:hypothetical protein